MYRLETRAYNGKTLYCKDWPQELALRIIILNFDPEVTEDSPELVFYSIAGKVAKNNASSQ
ncbi:MAG: hypothetical protein RMJ51_00270 [Candidatus Calescibacterium sp.]|nr:hypothetical protein [Candidatus Calescibacterium sp.]MCX7972046.1 hypothetical protein [bacterium]MDW8194670.1 hypothetical protein [Candidatus Calescibacterium sp.]